MLDPRIVAISVQRFAVTSRLSGVSLDKTQSLRPLRGQLVHQALAQRLAFDERVPDLGRVCAGDLELQPWEVIVQHLSKRLHVVVAQLQIHQASATDLIGIATRLNASPVPIEHGLCYFGTPDPHLTAACRSSLEQARP